MSTTIDGTYTARKNAHELATHAHKRVRMCVRTHTEWGLRPVGATIAAPAIANAIRCTPQLQTPCMRARVRVHLKVPGIKSHHDIRRYPLCILGI